MAFKLRRKPSQPSLHELGPVEPRGALSPEFLREVSAIQDRIGALRAQIEDLRRTRADALRDVSGAEAQSDVHDTVLESARTIDQSIRSLERGPQAGASMRSQVELLRARLLEALREYHAMEREARAGARARIERQLRIVNPEAMPEEVQQAFAAGPNQVFSQALLGVARANEVRDAVRQRQGELQQIERALVEVAALMEQLALVVQRDDDKIDDIQRNAQEAVANYEKGLEHMDEAIASARKARRRRIILVLVVVAIVIVVVAIAAAVIATQVS